MYAPLGFLGTFWRWIRQNMVDVELIFEILETHEFIEEVENPLPPSIHGGEIEFRNVTFSYGKTEEDKRIVIENLNFKVPAGKSVGIVG
jgi:ABC-type multidrug transport system fused ATPase/permease subunit